jgi:hypothetical protein
MPQITPEELAAPQPVAPKVQAVVDAWNNLDPEHLLAIEYSSLGDAIAALYAVLPEAPKAPEWIPVSERLPVSGMYLTVIVGDDVGVSHIDVSAFTASLDAWSIHWNEEVTHWMPLPVAPTTEEAPKETE